MLLTQCLGDIFGRVSCSRRTQREQYYKVAWPSIDLGVTDDGCEPRNHRYLQLSMIRVPARSLLEKRDEEDANEEHTNEEQIEVEVAGCNVPAPGEKIGRAANGR